jgi:hypothetical protein
MLLALRWHRPRRRTIQHSRGGDECGKEAAYGLPRSGQGVTARVERPPLLDGQNTLSIPRCENIPLYRNSDLSYVEAIPAHQRGGRTSSRTRAGLRWTRAASMRGLSVQGEMNLVSV